MSATPSAIIGPDAPPPTLSELEDFGSSVKNSPRHVLVVDDEPLIRWALAETLRGLGLDVDQAGDAASALRSITTAHLPFDVVVLDLRLPDMSDLSLLATVRQLLPDAVVVLMTAYETPEITSRALELGACGVLRKPFELADVTRIVLGPGRAA
jgi:DNA-binding NtrC family response regulator